MPLCINSKMVSRFRWGSKGCNAASTCQALTVISSKSAWMSVSKF
ncbi:Uncharacterised protein [Vibrio cholerae]|uniref:Uncharacterized protein n=1 Tax=Vibrio cholerae TaxID=666 RepID=A0A656AL61_VIBCL|nr:Uncharacterised protein [Vibrio cholerae]CSD69413.1 Uncharacterised protein [Vibrio cholerae]